MYQAPKLVKYGNFRDLTRQGAPCPNDPQITWEGKVFAAADPSGNFGIGDGCPARS